MRLLTPLTDWKVRQGSDKKYRYSLSVDKNNYCIHIEYEEKPGSVISPGYHGSMKNMFSLFPWMFKTEHDLVATRILRVVMERSNVSLLKFQQHFDNMEELGAWIDRTFETSFLRMYPTSIYDRFFKDNKNAGDNANSGK